jgi:hypothetical protein
VSRILSRFAYGGVVIALRPFIGGQDFHDRPVIFFRVSADSFQGINVRRGGAAAGVSFIVSGAELLESR